MVIDVMWGTSVAVGIVACSFVAFCARSKLIALLELAPEGWALYTVIQSVAVMAVGHKHRPLLASLLSSERMSALCLRSCSTAAVPGVALAVLSTGRLRRDENGKAIDAAGAPAPLRRLLLGFSHLRIRSPNWTPALAGFLGLVVAARNVILVAGTSVFPPWAVAIPAVCGTVCSAVLTVFARPRFVLSWALPGFWPSDGEGRDWHSHSAVVATASSMTRRSRLSRTSGKEGPSPEGAPRAEPPAARPRPVLKTAPSYRSTRNAGHLRSSQLLTRAYRAVNVIKMLILATMGAMAFLTVGYVSRHVEDYAMALLFVLGFVLFTLFRTLADLQQPLMERHLRRLLEGAGTVAPGDPARSGPHRRAVAGVALAGVGIFVSGQDSGRVSPAPPSKPTRRRQTGAGSRPGNHLSPHRPVTSSEIDLDPGTGGALEGSSGGRSGAGESRPGGIPRHLTRAASSGGRSGAGESRLGGIPRHLTRAASSAGSPRDRDT